ncbi:MAG: 1,6-anhydro-N-acetylmuramyl-L-alanine amidase AmpD [Pseudomonadales bacterium]|nr:1,6-anhydro-N-acetylmuramyl-L-alanine amidase AmpD [Pseudomonadales bacterium]
MHVKSDHRLARVRSLDSPNCNPRAGSAEIQLLVIHGISLPPGNFGTGMVADLFLNRLDCRADPALNDLEDVRVSAHLLIDRRGRITQFVPFSERAWHAGESTWRGCRDCNSISIGIELEGEDSRPYTRRQYRCLVKVTRALLERYPGLSRDAIVGHLEIAPGRKTDPGPAFDWGGYLSALW